MTDLLERLGLSDINSGAWAGGALDTSGGDVIASENPTTGETIASVALASTEHYEQVVKDAQDAFLKWRMLPAPKRGEIVREMGDAMREHKDDLGRLVTLEVGKILSEGLGEVQERVAK